MKQIKPCPFCGGDGKYIYIAPYSFVACKQCQTLGPHIADVLEQQDGREKAVTLWNNRTST